jgi:FkbM family methyltransferase
MPQQYFAPGVADWSHVKKFIDCGAYDGDTIERALKHCDLQAVAAFEPDIENFRLLAGRFVQGDFGIASGLLWPCGVWHETMMLRFRAGEQTSSHVDESGDSVISCVTLDEAVMGFRPDYIKMDIEGAEPNALIGARETIKRHRPFLAICLYHTPPHLWEIPSLIESWNQRYSFQLRSHGFNGFDSILYAMPQ